jgi:hypothetical protein
MASTGLGSNGDSALSSPVQIEDRMTARTPAEFYMRLPILIVLLASLGPPVLADDLPTLTYSNAATPGHDAAVALMNAELASYPDESRLSGEKVYSADVDIDMDGKPETLAFAQNTVFCGSAGCVPRLYRNADGVWAEVDLGLNEFTNSEPGDWTVGKPQNGYVSLVLTESEFRTTFVWDGTAYVSDMALAPDAGQVQFSNAPSDAHDLAKAFVEAEIGGSIEPQRVNVSDLDLNGDGYREILVFAYSDYYCGTKGCTPLLLQEQKDGNYRNILFGPDDFMNDDLQDWALSDDFENNYRVLIGEGSRFSFDGINYTRPRDEQVRAND